MSAAEAERSLKLKENDYRQESKHLKNKRRELQEQVALKVCAKVAAGNDEFNRASYKIRCRYMYVACCLTSFGPTHAAYE